MLRRTLGYRDLLFQFEGIVQVCADALELRRPSGKRIGLIVVEHVAHSQRQGIQVVLNAQELKRVFAVPAGKIVLQFAKTRNLHRDVPGVGDHRGQSDEESQKQTRSWGAARRQWAKHTPRI